MDQHPPDDRRITSGAVGTAWAMVAALVTLTALASAFAPQRSTNTPVTEQAALHTKGCTYDEGTGDLPDRAMRD
jgi:hypothetical protein